MKQAILFLLGLLIGAAAATIVSNALHRRDAYPHGVMDVMQHHFGSLREDLRTQRCTAAKLQRALQQMHALADDIEPAMYADSTPETSFTEFVQRLRDASSVALASPPADCASLAPVVEKIGKVCEDCHQQYR